MIEFLELAGLFPDITQEGFSAVLSTLSTSASVKLSGWTVTSPYFSSTKFNSTTGDYTAPVTGIYSMTATINYVTNSPITVSLSSDINPFFTIRRTSPAASDLISGLLPMNNFSLSLISLRGILGGGTVTLSGVVKLSADDIINLYYNSDNMTVALTLQNITWTVYRLA